MATLLGALGKYSTSQLLLPATMATFGVVGVGVVGTYAYRGFKNTFNHNPRQAHPSWYRRKPGDELEKVRNYVKMRWYGSRERQRQQRSLRNLDPLERMKSRKEQENQQHRTNHLHGAHLAKQDYYDAQRRRAAAVEAERRQRENDVRTLERQTLAKQRAWNQSSMNPFNWFRGKENPDQPESPRGPHGHGGHSPHHGANGGGGSAGHGPSHNRGGGGGGGGGGSRRRR